MTLSSIEPTRHEFARRSASMVKQPVGGLRQKLEEAKPLEGPMYNWEFKKAMLDDVVDTNALYSWRGPGGKFYIMSYAVARRLIGGEAIEEKATRPGFIDKAMKDEIASLIDGSAVLCVTRRQRIHACIMSAEKAEALATMRDEAKDRRVQPTEQLIEAANKIIKAALNSKTEAILKITPEGHLRVYDSQSRVYKRVALDHSPQRG